MGGIFYKKITKVNEHKGLNECFLEMNSKSKSNEKLKNYFILVNDSINRQYTQNRLNTLNIPISLEKKKFYSHKQSKNYIMNNNQEQIYWKDYLINFLYRISTQGYGWSRDLIMYVYNNNRFIKNEIFLSENRWLSQFFWQEFELKLKPKCFIIKSKNNYFKQSNLSDKILNSFSSSESESTNDINQNKDYKVNKQYIKSYIKIFEEHLIDTNHPINLIANYLCKVFTKFINDKLRDISILNSLPRLEYLSKINEIMDEVTQLLQKVILKLENTIKLMYSKTINFKCFIQQKDELIKLITNLIFNNCILYDAMTNFYNTCLEEKIKAFKKKLSKLKKVKPQSLNIKHKFCLDETTLAYQKKLLEDESNIMKGVFKDRQQYDLIKKEILFYLENRLSSPNNIESIYSESFFNSFSNSNSYHNMKLNIRESILNESTTAPNLKIIESNENDIKVYNASYDIKSPLTPSTKNSFSYERAIKTVKLIKNYQDPFQKIAVIASISHEITQCVNEFWKGMDIIMTSSLLNIDADELMSIFIYIIIKAQMPNLLIHMKIIKDFTTSITKTTMMGYYFATLEASILFILDFDLDETNFKTIKCNLNNK